MLVNAIGIAETNIYGKKNCYFDYVIGLSTKCIHL